jgi:hypothetical protein
MVRLSVRLPEGRFLIWLALDTPPLAIVEKNHLTISAYKNCQNQTKKCPKTPELQPLAYHAAIQASG